MRADGGRLIAAARGEQSGSVDQILWEGELVASPCVALLAVGELGSIWTFPKLRTSLSPLSALLLLLGSSNKDPPTLSFLLLFLSWGLHGQGPLIELGCISMLYQ